ncbi:hypothetical protein FHG87_010154 [Trinorchestia longiramus]|nr:hypothetical protein FHG87_010154 [Trinorchestia longiramus]
MSHSLERLSLCLVKSLMFNRQRQLLNTFGLGGSSKCSFFNSGRTTLPLSHSQQYEHLSRNTESAHTDPLRPVWTESEPCPPESEFCFVEACDGSDIANTKFCTPAPSGCGTKSNFVHKVVGAFRNMNQRSTKWVNPNYLAGPALKSVQPDHNLLPHLQRKKPNLMGSQAVLDSELNCYSSSEPQRKGGNSSHLALDGANTFSYFGPAELQGVWQNGDVLGSQGDQLLFQNLSSDQFLLQQQQQYRYYQSLQNNKLPSNCSDSSGSNYGSDIDDSWNIVSACDCVENNYSSVNGNTAPPGVISGLLQLSAPTISCVNVTAASQLFNTTFYQSIPNASFSTDCSPRNCELFGGKFQNQDNFEAVTHEFSLVEAPEVPVNEAFVASPNFYPIYTDVPGTSKMTAAGDSQDLLALNQTNKLPLVESSLNPNAEEWNGWVSNSKLNPEAKEWIPTTVENVQNAEISHQVDNVGQDSIKQEAGEEESDEAFNAMAQSRIGNVDSESAKCAEFTFNIDALSDESSESSSVISPTTSNELHNSHAQESTMVDETDGCSPKVLCSLSMSEKPSTNLCETFESSLCSEDGQDTCDYGKLSANDVPELSLSCDTVKQYSDTNYLESEFSDELALKSVENVPSDLLQDVTEGALSKTSSCTFLEKLKNFSFSPCKWKSSSSDESDDVCEFIIFSEEDQDCDAHMDNFTDADDDTSDDSDSSDSDTESENEDVSCIDSDESFDEYDINSFDDSVEIYVTPSSEPIQTEVCTAKPTSLCAFWLSLEQQQQQQQQCCADLSDDDWDFHSESNSGSISATCWAFEQGLMTLKTPINTLSKRLGYVEKERKKSLTEVEKANLKWDTEIDDNVQGNSGIKVHFDDDVSFCYVEKDIQRKGEWEQIARDNCRFRNRIRNLCGILSPVLDAHHRNAVYQERFRPSLDEETINAGER